MDEKIRQKLRENKIREIKNPTILMNDAIIPDVSNAVCGMPNCQKKVHRLGYCQKHYKLYMMFPAY